MEEGQSMRKRSKYRPRPVIIDTVSYVISGMKQMKDCGSILTTLQLKNHLALEALRTGKAVLQDIEILMTALNMCEALSKIKIGEDYEDEIRVGQQALFDCAKRGAKNHHFVVKGVELTAINFAMELHDAQLEASTVKDIELATQIVNNAITNKTARPVIERENV
jgi:hypothetical protein